MTQFGSVNFGLSRIAVLLFNGMSGCGWSVWSVPHSSRLAQN